VRRLARCFSVALTALVLVAVAACDSAERPDLHATTPVGAASAGATDGPRNSAVPEPGSEFPDLDIPADAQMLVPILHGTGSRDTPKFSIPRMKYSVYLACTGSGTLRVGDRETKPAPCDGRTRRAHTISAAKSATVSIASDGSVRWSVAVVDTDDFKFSTPKPTNSSA
jgi:hypothetical protein